MMLPGPGDFFPPDEGEDPDYDKIAQGLVDLWKGDHDVMNNLSQ